MPTNRCDEIVRLIDEALADDEHATASPRPYRHQHDQGRPSRELEVPRHGDPPGVCALPRGPLAIEAQRW